MSSILSKLINLAGTVSGTLGVVNGGTGVTASTGTVAVVLSTTPTLVTPVLGVASATSVTFPSGGNTAMNWYEQGTFTPAVIGSTTSGTTVTYSFTPVGVFTRIGRNVAFHVALTWTNWTGSPTGALQVSGLPYASTNVANDFNIFACLSDNLVIPAGGLWLNAGMANNTSVFTIYAGKTAANSQFLDVSLQAGSATRSIYVTGSYDV